MILRTNSQLDELKGIWVIPVFQEDLSDSFFKAVEATCGDRPSFLKTDFKAEHGELLPLYANGGNVYLLGLGRKRSFSSVLKAFRSFSFKQKEKLSPEISLSILHENAGSDPEMLIEAAVNGLLLGTYQIGKFKQEKEDNHPFCEESACLNLFVKESHIEPLNQAAERGLEVAKTQLKTYDLVNAPGNKKTPQDLSSWAKLSGKAFDYRVKVLGREEIEARRLEALLAVNRGSEHPPSFIIMNYEAPKKQGQKTKKIGLVGKGVTFDTGGLSLKPSTNMHFMKSDMGGAAAVFGAVELAAKFQLPVDICGIVPATENSVDSLSIKPGDVIASHSGKTIEVIDTDAEGRLILADGLSFMVDNFKPDVLIDLATLTGSAIRTLGYHAAALFSNDDQLASQLSESGDRNGERLWRLPIWEVYKDDLKSDVADVRNFSGKPLAGSIGAAKFLEVFTNDHPSWAHLDIAGVAFCDSEFSNQKSATAFGVRLLFDYLCRLVS